MNTLSVSLLKCKTENLFNLIDIFHLQGGQLYPPTVLLEFHPLAAYCNDILTALNELRLCSSVAIVTEICDVLHESFLNINKVILAFFRYGVLFLHFFCEI